MPQQRFDVQYISDGGPWPYAAKYKDICRQYIKYTDHVSKIYCEAVVVFDGYEGTSAKDMTQQRVTKGIVGSTVAFREDMDALMKKEHFLDNKKNKQQFINMLTKELKRQHCQFTMLLETPMCRKQWSVLPPLTPFWLVMVHISSSCCATMPTS